MGIKEIYSWLPLALLMTALASLGSGCGQINTRKPLKVPLSSTSSSTTSNVSLTGAGGLAGPEGYICPAQANVMPQNTVSSLDGKGSYQVCYSSQDQSMLSITGETFGATSFCVYPVEVVSDTEVYIKRDPVTYGPWSKCVQNNVNGAGVAFENTSYNAVLIVDSTDRNQMNDCLLFGGVCPRNSYGLFR